MKRKFKTGILVRDKMVSLMEEQGIVVHKKILNIEEYTEALKNKLIEESNEVIEEINKVKVNKEELTEEIADLYEVIDCIKKRYNINDNEIIDKKNKKIESKGSFTKGEYTQYLEIEENNPAINYYLNRPKKYPEEF